MSMKENPYEPPRVPSDASRPVSTPSPPSLLQTTALYFSVMFGALIGGLFLIPFLGIDDYPFSLIDFLAGAFIGGALAFLAIKAVRRLLSLTYD